MTLIHSHRISAGAIRLAWVSTLLLAGCAGAGRAPVAHGSQPLAAPVPVVTLPTGADASLSADYAWLNRLTWGATSSALAQVSQQGRTAYLQAQLHPGRDALPPQAQTQIDQLPGVNQPLDDLVQTLEQQRKEADAQTNDDTKKMAQQAYQQALNNLQREAATRYMLRALYSPYQVQEEMTWFWFNHFNVHQGKNNVRAMLGDYESQAIRTHALGHFRDLLGAVVLHPAMLRYLDNDQNAAGHINENFARELMELHTLGVDGGYTQGDVQELARVLTGLGLNQGDTRPGMNKNLAGYYVRHGLTEFNPQRHDFGPKTLLGKPIQGKGLGEIEEALDRLASHPATARFVCGKLARFWLADEPPAALVQRMVTEYMASQGDIAQVLTVLFNAPEFVQAPPQHFKDPVRYVVSSVRLAYDRKVVLNVSPMVNWLNRMGEPLYGRLTPDGYPLSSSAWSSPGQMATRFEIAKAIGSGSAGLFKTDGPQPQDRPAFPQLANPLYYQAMARTLSSATAQALDQAVSPQEWNTFLLAAPEMMVR